MGGTIDYAREGGWTQFRVSVPLAENQGSLVVPAAVVGEGIARRPTTHAASILGQDAHVP
jgi:hypothetical protein